MSIASSRAPDLERERGNASFRARRYDEVRRYDDARVMDESRKRLVASFLVD